MQNMKRLFIVLTLCGLTARSPAAGESARDIIKESGVRGGLVVHLGSGDGKFTAELRADDRFVVHGLYPRREQTDEARKHIWQLNLYGAVSVRHWDRDKKYHMKNYQD